MMSFLIILSLLAWVVATSACGPGCCNHTLGHPCLACEGVGGVLVNASFLEEAGCQVLAKDRQLVWPMWPKGDEMIFNVSAWEVLRPTPGVSFITGTCFDCYVPQETSLFYKGDARLGPSLRRDALFQNAFLNFESIMVSVGDVITTKLSLVSQPLINICFETPIESEVLASSLTELSWIFEDLFFVGTELLQVEAGVGGIRVNHFARNLFHIWTEPDTGLVMRIWNAGHGLTVFPKGLYVTPNRVVSDDFFTAPCDAHLGLRGRSISPLYGLFL